MSSKGDTKFHLKGKTVFISALLTIGLTFLTVYLTGINFNRSLTNNLFISLGIISFTIFIFLTISLYRGTRLIDNYPKTENYKPGEILSSSELPQIHFDGGDGLGGFLMSILLWIGMAILMVLLLLLFEAIFWISLFIIFASLYWIFIRALKMVFHKNDDTRGNLPASIFNAAKYTILYTVWFFAIAFIVEFLSN